MQKRFDVSNLTLLLHHTLESNESTSFLGPFLLAPRNSDEWERTPGTRLERDIFHFCILLHLSLFWFSFDRVINPLETTDWDYKKNTFRKTFQPQN